MSTRQVISDEMDQLVERQLRRWEIGRAQRRENPTHNEPVSPFVTISNTVGAGGRDIAEALAARLNWPIFDRNLLTVMADNDKWRARIYQSLDERDVGWFEQTVRSLLDQSFVRNDYFRRLTETVLNLARQSSAIFLGRFADLILPRERGLRVKITAPMTRCAANFARHTGVSLQEAERAVHRIDQEREDFLKRHFPSSCGERGRFDLWINSESFATTDAVELIIKAMKGRSPSTPRSSDECA